MPAKKAIKKATKKKVVKKNLRNKLMKKKDAAHGENTEMNPSGPLAESLLFVRVVIP